MSHRNSLLRSAGYGLSAALLLAVAMSSDSFAQSPFPNAIVDVNCDEGETVTEALETANPGDTIRAIGTCNETVRITTDRVTLDGQGSAILDGGGRRADVITIDGARGVTITGLTVQNGREGILAINDATFTLDDTTVQNNTSHGIELVGASADARNITSRQNGRVGVIIARNSLIDLTDTTLPHNLSGLVVFSNSVVRLFGTNRMNESRTQGVTVGLGGVAFAIGSTLLANDNGAEGMLLLQDGKVQLIGGTLEANNNASDGIRLLQNSSMILGIEEFGVSGKAVTMNNAANGVSAATGSDLAASPIMPLTSQGNGMAGVRLDDRSSATISGADLTNNSTADVDLSFGSQATLNGNTIGTIACDMTALIRGDTRTVCPTGRNRSPVP